MAKTSRLATLLAETGNPVGQVCSKIVFLNITQEFTNREHISKSIKSNIMRKTLQFGKTWELATL